MGIEIERKFRVVEDALPPLENGTRMRQGYLSGRSGATVRVRVSPGAAYLTIKGATRSITRSEFEYSIPIADGEALLDLRQGRLIEKTRYRVPIGAHVFEVDVFEGDNAGLVIAEVELGSEGEVFSSPDWLAEEVSHDHRFTNASLAAHPYSEWPDEPR